MNVYDLNDIEEKEIIPGYFARFLHSDNMTLAYWRIEAGAPMPEHSHPNEQVTNLIEGVFELVVKGKSTVLRQGSVVIIPPNIPHSGTAITECRIIDAFYPLRPEYK